ncbi:MAG: MG2 domain-containing protein [Thermodesulfovibrionales bacterium]
MSRFLGYMTLVSVFFLSAVAYGFEVESFKPLGYVKSPEQVVARFSSQMVSLGSPHEYDPFDIDCPVKGKSHWLDTKTWAFDFDEVVPSGTVCTFRLKDNVKDIQGRIVNGKRNFTFNTGGPSIIEVLPFEGSDNIDERQIFLLRLDGQVKKGSVLRNVHCIVSGINERVGISIVSEKETEALFKSLKPRPFEREDYILAVKCNRTFPNRSDIKIVWQKGMESPSGLTTPHDQILSFKTRDVFRARFSCQRESPQSQCIPLLPLQIRFTSPIKVKDAERIILRTQDSKIIKPTLNQYDIDEGYTYLVSFKGPFKEKSEYTIDIPKDLKDDSGRLLSNINQFPLKVKTDVYPPIAKFPSRFGIIESKSEPAVPITVRNIEEQINLGMLNIQPQDISELKGSIHKPDDRSDKAIIQWLMKVASAGRTSSILKGVKSSKNITIPKPHKRSDFEVVGIPLESAGFYVIEVQSRLLGRSLLGKDRPMYVQTAQLVTNLAVHFKKGRDSSLVWVTNLDDANPSENTDISIRDCKGNLIHSGKTDKNGILFIKKSLPSYDKLPSCEIKHDEEGFYDYPQLLPLNNLSRGLFVFARKGNDLSFVHTSWDRGIEPYRYNLRLGGYDGNMKAHTILDRPIYRADETVHMSHLIRLLNIDGFDYPKRSDLPDTLVVTHIGSEQTFTMPLRWDSNFTAQSEWKIPIDAKLGAYQIQMKKKDKSFLNSGMFRVEEFKVPLMKATIKPVRETLIAPKDIDIDISLNYLSGGGARHEKVKFRHLIGPHRLFFQEYDEFEIARGGVKVGLQRRGVEIGDETDEVATNEVTTTELTLDKYGFSRINIKNILPVRSVMQLKTEIEYKDPNGEINTTSYNIPLYPSSVLLGILPEHWTAKEDNVKVDIAALTPDGKVLRDIEVKVEIFKKRFYSHRKRLIGGFYSYEHLIETKRLKDVCSGKTDHRGIFQCEFSPNTSGNIIIQASATDHEGNESLTYADVWVSGKDEQWFDVSDTDRIDLIPEKRQYDVGQDATFQVRMPFRSATALVTVEREGIIDAFVTRVSGKDPTITLPIKENYTPNVFISALVVRGRVGDVKPTAMIDLAKPSFKLGISEIKVGWRNNELMVKVTTDKDKYRVRGKVNAKVEIAPVNRSATFQRDKTTVTVAVIDEGLLEMAPNRSWNILQSMMELRGYDVNTSTAQLQVVGKRHFGLKALPSGGGGGRQITRELFDTLIYWNPNLQIDENGNGEFAFELNDSLTSFVIAVVTHSGKSLFGSGFKTIKTWQDIMLFSGLPKMVREADSYDAVFTTRNVSSSDAQITLTAEVEGKSLPVRQIDIPAGESKEVSWRVDAPKGLRSQQWRLTAQNLRDGTTDSIKVRQIVNPLWQQRVIHSDLMMLSTPAQISIKADPNTSTEKDKIDLVFSKGITNSLNIINEYMKEYPYTCLEQLVSRAVTLNSKNLWANITARMPTYMDNSGLLKYFPSMNYGSDVLTTYVLTISHEAGLKMPENIRERLLDGLTEFVRGKGVGYSPIKTADMLIRKISAMSALSRYREIEPEMFTIINMDIALMPTSTLLDYIHLLRVSDGLKSRDKIQSDAINALISRINLQGGLAVFNTERTDRLIWLMVSPDTNMARTILTLLDDPAHRDTVRRLVIGFVKRQSRGIWDTTISNAWGSIALKRFSDNHEQGRITGNTTVSLNGQKRSLQWLEKEDEHRLSFTAPTKQTPLEIRHDGTGIPWLMMSVRSSKPLKEPVFSGYALKKTLLKEKKGAFSVGDIVRVRIEIEAKADMTWVVLKDPLPSGGVITGVGLHAEKSDGHMNIVPVFEERASDSYRAYFDYMPKGRWQIEYVMRLNTSGQFNIPNTRVEALYSPDIFGELPNDKIVVKRGD